MNQVEQNSNPAQLLILAEQTAREAGALLRQQWREPQQVEHKAFRSWVTEADYASQALIVARIQAAFPEHGFLPEEEAPDLASSGDVLWIVDPVDGTSNFSRQQPNFCISIAAARSGQIQVGVIYDPIRDEMFAASVGIGATMNGEPMAVSSVRELPEAILAFDWGHSAPKRQATLDILQATAHQVHTVRAIGSAALALAWLAAGRLDAYFNINIKAWDLAAGLLLISEAGGRCTDLDNDPCLAQPKGEACLASNGHLHEPIYALLHEALT